MGSTLRAILGFPLHVLRAIPWPGIVRRHPVWSTVIAVLVALVTLVVVAVSRPPQPEYVLDTVKRGDVSRTVEAVGTVISERDLSLQFPVSGVLEQVSVDEGDAVTAGQVLARLRSGRIGADIQSAAARLQSAQADLERLREGSRPEDIAVAEAEVLNRKASLDASRAAVETLERKVESSQSKLTTLRAEAQTSLAGSVQSAGTTAQRYLAIADSSLRVLDDVLENAEVYENAQWQDAGEYDVLRRQQQTVAAKVSAALAAPTARDYGAAIGDLEIARATVGDVAEVIRRVYDFVAELPVTGRFSVADRETHKDTLATERATVQSAMSSIDAAWKDLRDASAAFDTKIAAEEATLVSAQGELDRALADVQTAEAALRITEAQLQLKLAGSRPQDIAAAEARVRQEAASLARARADYADTVLVAPIDGTITKVSVKAGELSPTGAAVTMLGESPYRIEVFASEIDIPLVALSQSGSIELDAFPGRPIPLRVSEIDPAATLRDGVPKYRIVLDFIDPPEGLRIGMTGDAEIVTGVRKDVLSVPRRSVIERGTGAIVRVLESDGSVEERLVTTGMEGGDGEIEVLGLREGETVIVLVKE